MDVLPCPSPRLLTAASHPACNRSLSFAGSQAAAAHTVSRRRAGCCRLPARQQALGGRVCGGTAAAEPHQVTVAGLCGLLLDGRMSRCDCRGCVPVAGVMVAAGAAC